MREQVTCGVARTLQYPPISRLNTRLSQRLSPYPAPAHPSPSPRAPPGTIVVLLYALIGTVVLANLLIALISYHFQPEKVRRPP